MQEVGAVVELLTKIADDQLFIGHRNSEWTGIGPVLEEDIAFSSLAQDKVGHSLNTLNLLSKIQDIEVDAYAFLRKPHEYKCCHLVQYPIGDYSFSLVRHFLFDHAEYLRYDLLTDSALEPLRNMARKFKPEIKYHVYHANTWVKNLSAASEAAHSRIQEAVDQAYPLALSIFEPGPNEEKLREAGVFEGEQELSKRWKQHVHELLDSFGLHIPQSQDETYYGGRYGSHTAFLPPLLDEMTEVISSEDKDIVW